jgi:hypothetical protein
VFEDFANCIRRERTFLCVPAPKQPQYLVAHTRVTTAPVMSYKISHAPIANKKVAQIPGSIARGLNLVGVSMPP